jgi:endonuclease IV
VLGDSFEELATLLAGLNRKDVHVCLDTATCSHGYDIRTGLEDVNSSIVRARTS